MKKRHLLSGIFAAFAVFVLASCDSNDAALKELKLEGAKTEFTVGDTFDSSTLEVNAVYADKSVNVTSEVEIVQNADMSKAGTYAVLVKYGNQTVAYEIKVNAKATTLKSVTANTTLAKTVYEEGETISYDNVSLNYVYEDASGNKSYEVVTDLSDYTKKVVDAAGKEVTGKFTDSGEYTVKISKADTVASYKVAVVTDLSTPAKAIAVAVDHQRYVKSGTVIDDGIKYFEYGDNYLVVSYETEKFDETTWEAFETTVYEHYSLTKDGDGFAVASYSQGDNVVLGLPEGADDVTKDSVKGVRNNTILGYDTVYYGAADILSKLYETAQQSDNFEESAAVCPCCGSVTDVDFSFNKLVEVYEDYYYYYNIVVHACIGEKGIIEYMNIDSQYYYYGFTVDSETGKVTLDEDVESIPAYSGSIRQEVGERTAVNEYKAEDLCFTDMKLFVDDVELGDDDALEFEEIYASKTITFELTPSTGSLAVDTPTLEYDYSGLYAYAMGNEIVVTAYAGGEYTLEITTTFCNKVIHISVKYPDPTAMDVYKFNADENPKLSYFDDDPSEETLALVNQAVYVAGAPYLGDDYGGKTKADPNKYTVSITSDNKAKASLVAEQKIYGSDETTANLYKFVATEIGTYTLEFVSTIDNTVTATYTIEVIDPSTLSLANSLNGKYTCYSSSDVYVTVEFVPTTEGALSGTATVTLDDYFFGGSYAAVYSYTGNEDTKAVTFQKTSGDDFTFSITTDAFLNLYVTVTTNDNMVNNTKLNKVTEEIDDPTPQPELEFPTAWQGTWTGEYGVGEGKTTIEITITEDSFTFLSDGYEVTETVELFDGIIYYGVYILGLQEDGTILLSDWYSELTTLTKDAE